MESTFSPAPKTSPESQGQDKVGPLSSASTKEGKHAPAASPNAPAPAREGNKDFFPPLRQQGVLNVDELLLPLPDDAPAFQSAGISAAPSVSYLMRRAQRGQPEREPLDAKESRDVQQAISQAPSEPDGQDTSLTAETPSSSARRTIKEGEPGRTQEKRPTPPEKSVWDNITFSRLEAGSAKAARPAPYRLRKNQTGDPWRTPNTSPPTATYTPLLPPPEVPLPLPQSKRPHPGSGQEHLSPASEQAAMPPENSVPFVFSPPGGLEIPPPPHTLWRSNKGPKASPSRYSVIPGVEDEVLLPLDFDEAPFIPDFTPVEAKKNSSRPPLPPWPRAHQTPAARRSTLAAASRIMHTQPGPGLRRDRIMGLRLVDDDAPTCSSSRLEGVSLVDEESGRTRENICLVDDDALNTRNREYVSPQGGIPAPLSSRQNTPGGVTGMAGKLDSFPFPRLDDETYGFGRDFALVGGDESHDSLRNISLVDLADEELGRNNLENDNDAEEKSGWGVGGLIRRMLGKVFGKKPESASHKKLLELSLASSFAVSSVAPAHAQTTPPGAVIPLSAPSRPKSVAAHEMPLLAGSPQSAIRPDVASHSESWDSDDDAPVWTPPLLASAPASTADLTIPETTGEGEMHVITLSGGVRSAIETPEEELHKPSLLGWITKLLRREGT